MRFPSLKVFTLLVLPSVAFATKQQVFMNDAASSTSNSLLLSDILTVERRAQIWYDYAREVKSVNILLTQPGPMTLLVPVNSAIVALPRKPHQSPPETPTVIGITPQEQDLVVNKRLEDFLSGHIVPGRVINVEDEDSVGPFKTLRENIEVTLVKDGDDYVVKEGGAKVLDVKNASNGRIIFINGVIDLPTA